MDPLEPKTIMDGPKVSVVIPTHNRHDKLAALIDCLLRQTLPGKPLAPVLHRVVERTVTDGQIVVRTKGDANESPDPETHVLQGAVITPVFHVARLGYVMSFVRTPTGWVTVILLPALLICLSLFIRRPARKPVPK